MSGRHLRENPVSDGYLDPLEINVRTCNVLLRLMSGMLLTLTGILLGLFVPAVVMAAADNSQSATIWPWALTTLLVALAIGLILAFRRTHGDRNGQTSRQKVSTTPPTTGSQQDSDIASLSEDSLARLLDQHIQRCAAQSAPLAVIAVRADHNEEQHRSILARSLRGLAKSRGARLVQFPPGSVVVLAPSQNRDEAFRLAEELHQSVISMALPSDHNSLGVVTPSIGMVALLPTCQTSAAKLLDRVEQALEKATGAGGNRIEAWTH